MPHICPQHVEVWRVVVSRARYVGGHCLFPSDHGVDATDVLPSNMASLSGATTLPTPGSASVTGIVAVASA